MTNQTVTSLSPLLIDITLICAIVALILSCIVPAIICYFGCVCVCCCCPKEACMFEKEKKGNSVRYCVKSTRSKSQSKSTEGGSQPRSKKSTRTPREKSIP